MSRIKDLKDMAALVVALWNLAVPSGTPVDLTDDLGQVRRTKTRSAAWQLPGGHPMIQVEGMRGGYSLLRIRPVAWGAAEEGEGR